MVREGKAGPESKPGTMSTRVKPMALQLPNPTNHTDGTRSASDVKDAFNSFQVPWVAMGSE